MPFISVPSLNFITNVRNVVSSDQPAEDEFWQNSGWTISESSWRESPDSVVDNGSFEEGIDGWDDHSEPNFTDENGDENVFETTWNSNTQKMKFEVTPNDLQYQAISSKLIQYPFDSDIWYKLKSTINFLPQNVTPSTKLFFSIWKDGDVPDIDNTFAEQSFDVDQLTNGQEISLDFMPTDGVEGVLEALQIGFRLSDDSTDSTDNVEVEVDDVKVTDSQDDELERTYTLSTSVSSVTEGHIQDGGNGSLYITLEAEGLTENTKVPFYVEVPEAEGTTAISNNGQMTNKDEFGPKVTPNVFLLTLTSTSHTTTSTTNIQVMPDVVCVRPQTIAVWIPHPDLEGRENALAEVEFDVQPNTDSYDKSGCEPIYSGIQKNNSSPEEGDTMGFDLVGQRMTQGVIPEGSEYPIGTWQITNASIGISSPTSGTFLIDNDNNVSITTVSTISDGVYTGTGGSFTMNVTIGETTLSTVAGFSDSSNPPDPDP